MTLPECVNAWLEATGKKQNAVAKDGGLKASQVSEIASGKINPRWRAVEQLAKGFGVSTAVFLAGPRPEIEAGHAERPREGSQVLERLLHQLDADAPAEDTWRGDVLKAIAALNRALRRKPDSGATGDAPASARR